MFYGKYGYYKSDLFFKIAYSRDPKTEPQMSIGPWIVCNWAVEMGGEDVCVYMHPYLCKQWSSTCIQTLFMWGGRACMPFVQMELQAKPSPLPAPHASLQSQNVWGTLS